MTAMIDMAFEASGESLPPAYPFALWAELTRHVPQLEGDDSVGVLPLRTAESGADMLLPRRAKLVLRLPHTLMRPAAALSGTNLDISGSALHLGAGQPRQMQPHPTLHAQLVTGAEDEVEFLEEMRASLSAMGIQAGLICGKHKTLADAGRSLAGFSLVVHDLKPEASLSLQSEGLGEGRHFGCGIFLPYKVISGLG
ncbi:MAG: type I-MYXAN CRISPR-associated protein Cas6/Cmx6 [Gallionellales bacterium RIFCSPLOWO2_12_FULL_59_22]|nr:MAG: type I-MYXAN CRISPR-associated protein Cas6/Cmx6 [Gallionellales bacterium RIFCSPLOWO2_02_58_13]OGT13184.1 MAG: type I-MYXAN CRISPR-associated protein Cas6/Cmx6 [Gallionellales bacterium RIFCSPLOWO2_12_FULL_59_22]